MNNYDEIRDTIKNAYVKQQREAETHRQRLERVKQLYGYDQPSEEEKAEAPDSVRKCLLSSARQIAARNKLKELEESNDPYVEAILDNKAPFPYYNYFSTDDRNSFLPKVENTIDTGKSVMAELANNPLLKKRPNCQGLSGLGGVPYSSLLSQPMETNGLSRGSLLSQPMETNGLSRGSLLSQPMETNGFQRTDLLRKPAPESLWLNPADQQRALERVWHETVQPMPVKQFVKSGIPSMSVPANNIEVIESDDLMTKIPAENLAMISSVEPDLPKVSEVPVVKAQPATMEMLLQNEAYPGLLMDPSEFKPQRDGDLDFVWKMYPKMREHEGFTNYIYLDTNFNLTVGAGKNIDSPKNWEAAYLVHPNCSNFSSEEECLRYADLHPIATPEERAQCRMKFEKKKDKIKERRMREFPNEKVINNNRADSFIEDCDLRMPEIEVQRAYVTHALDNLRQIRNLLPDFDKMDPDLKDVILDMVYNMGIGNFEKSLFYTALKANNLDKKNGMLDKYYRSWVQPKRNNWTYKKLKAVQSRMQR